MLLLEGPSCTHIFASATPKGLHNGIPGGTGDAEHFSECFNLYQIEMQLWPEN